MIDIGHTLTRSTNNPEQTWPTTAIAAADFKNNRYMVAGSPVSESSFVDCTRASTGLAENLGGSYQEFAANLARRTNKGLLIEPGSTNLFLNSDSPATQSISVVTSTEYTISIIGAGSIVLSGAGTGTVTAGGSVTLTAISTTLTCTVTGSPDYAQVETGGVASSPILTSGGSAVRNADIIRCDEIATQLATLTRGIVVVDMDIPVINDSGYPGYLSLSDGSVVNIWSIIANSAGQLKMNVRSSNLERADVALGLTISGRNKVAFGFKANGDVYGSANGATAISLSTGFSGPSFFNQANIGSDYEGTVLRTSTHHAISVLDEEPTATRVEELSAL